MEKDIMDSEMSFKGLKENLQSVSSLNGEKEFKELLK